MLGMISGRFLIIIIIIIIIIVFICGALFPCGSMFKGALIDMMNTWYIHNTYIIWYKIKVE